MSNSHSHNAAGAGVDLAGVEVEPDNVPTKLLSLLAVAITIVVAALVVTAIYLFDVTKASELEAKGYTVEDRIPRDLQ